MEPMTCGPDAFNAGPTHDGMIVLAPGESYTGSWGVRRKVAAGRLADAKELDVVTQSQHQCPTESPV